MRPLTSSPGGPIRPGGPRWSRYVLPSEPRTRFPSVDPMATVAGRPFSVSPSLCSRLRSNRTELCVVGGLPLTSGEGETVPVSLLESAEALGSDGILGGAGKPSEGFLWEPPMSKSMISSEGFPGNSDGVLPLESFFFSVVMFSSKLLDDGSGFPFWRPFGPLLEGFHWGFTCLPFWKTVSNKSVSSSTKRTPPRPTEPFRLGLEGTVPSPRELPCRRNVFCWRRKQELGLKFHLSDVTAAVFWFVSLLDVNSCMNFLLSGSVLLWWAVEGALKILR